MFKTRLLVFLFIFSTFYCYAQDDNGVMSMDESRFPRKRQIIRIPGFDGYQTLKCDFHMHTIFSDGQVWPTIRVQEAWQEGMDAMAISDHIEYTPHSKDVVVDHNRAYEIGEDMAAENNIILIKGNEITRNTPPGHFNAIFIGDSKDYIADRDNAKDKQAVMKAADQDAFIFWNHPGWKVNSIDGSYEWIDLVDELLKEKILGGIEVFNGFKFHKKALDWCVDNNLAVMGSTDMHNIVGYSYNLENGAHRTMTLVFAKERTARSVREALEEGRTVAWSTKYIAGKEEWVSKLFYASVEVSPVFHAKTRNEKTTNYYEIKNNSDLYFEMELKSGKGNKNITLYPQSSQVISANEGQEKLTYEVVTAFVRSDKNLVVDIPLK
ncbi:histidinol-phosphatase [Maribellus sp. CM-23]|uniref:Sb-PDE family phosphodiesterase n=1 Tax=Maribellus sp. CM-23 TaxID=2781026 RepID=UPI001F16A429|nr:Sb-PDE family phosphodiesterase [Maribellus sp. CM-23]MCE4565984.1 histidinol-phosphatase [Maribellus sp. CM-23]